MPDSSNQDYIRKTVAIDLLNQLLENEAIDEVVVNRMIEKFSQTLEDSSPRIDQLPDLSLTVISSTKSVKIIGPQGFHYKLVEVPEESLNLLEGESAFQLHIYSLEASPDPIARPEGSQIQIIIPRSGSRPTIHIIKPSSPGVMMSDPIDRPSWDRPLMEAVGGGIDAPPPPSGGGIDNPGTRP